LENSRISSEGERAYHLDDVRLKLCRENRKFRKSDIVAWDLSQTLELYREKRKESELYEETWPGTT